MQLKKKKSTHNKRKKSEGSRMWASFFLINGDCSSNPDCMRRMNTQSTAAALQATLSFVLTIQMSSRAWRTLQKQRRARGAWLQSGSTFFLIYRGFPWLCFPVMMLCQLLFMILSQLSARCELQRSYDFRALTGSKSSPSDGLRAFGRAGWWAPVRTVRICVGFRARVICNVKPGSTSIAAALNRSTCSGSYKITAWAGEADWSRGRRRRCVLWPCKSEGICKPWLKEETGEEAAAFCRAEGWVSRDGSRQREQHRIGEQQTHTHFWFKGNLLCFYLFPFIHMHS